jgi:hypothetical protein
MAPLSGIGLMMKSMGIDPDEIRGDVEKFMSGVKVSIAKIDAAQVKVEAKLDEIILALATEKAVNRGIAGSLETLLAIQAGLADAGSTITLRDDQGRSLGVLETTEKFPQEVIDAVNAEANQK